MKVLNLYFSSTGNTEKVARKIDETVQALGVPGGYPQNRFKGNVA